MTFAIRVEGLSKEWAGKPVFQRVDFEVAEGERVALFGRNGVGKTTLICCLMGTATPDKGTILRRYETDSWGWLEQHNNVDGETTLLSFVQGGEPQLHQLRMRLDSLQSELETATQTVGDSLRLTHAYSQLHEQYLAENGYEWEVSVEQTLTRFGFAPRQYSVPFVHLSGGEKTRAQFARLIIRQPKLLVLDEPTNHLDEETLTWLENWLKDYAGTVLFVSHDRSFIDAVADAILELTPDGMRRYPGGYTAFRTQREAGAKAQQALYDKQQREKKHLQEAIQQYTVWYQKAHAAAGTNDFFRSKAEKNSTRMKAKQRALQRLESEMVQRPQTQSSIRATFADGQFEASTLVTLCDVTFGYTRTPLFEQVRARVGRGDKIALVGRNGTGKSTLLKLLTGHLLPAAGQVERHPVLRVGFFAQELEDLDLSQTVLDTILSIPGMTQSHARTVLAGFLFPRDEVFKRASELSMGERCRLAFVKLYFSEANLLVLDEPTNYLDIDTRERIEEALAAYPGSLLIVTHDRFLTRRVATQIWHLQASDAADSTESSALTVFPGSYDEWLSSRLKPSSHSPELDNQIRQLEHQLAQLIAVESAESAEEAGFVEKARRIRRELEALRSVGTERDEAALRDTAPKDRQ